MESSRRTNRSSFRANKTPPPISRDGSRLLTGEITARRANLGESRASDSAMPKVDDACVQISILPARYRVHTQLGPLRYRARNVTQSYFGEVSMNPFRLLLSTRRDVLPELAVSNFSLAVVLPTVQYHRNRVAPIYRNPSGSFKEYNLRDQ